MGLQKKLCDSQRHASAILITDELPACLKCRWTNGWMDGFSALDSKQLGKEFFLADFIN